MRRAAQRMLHGLSVPGIPNNLPGSFFRFDPNSLTSNTVVGGQITVANDALGRAKSLTPRGGTGPTRVAALLNGNAGARFTMATNEQLDTLTDGVASGAGASIWYYSVCVFRNSPSSALKLLFNQGGWLEAGSAWFGTFSPGIYETGGVSGGATTAGDTDQIRFILNTFDGTNSRVYMGGRLMTTLAESFSVASTAFGFRAPGFMPDADCFFAEWGSGALPTQADQDRLGLGLKARFGPLMYRQVLADGDSITEGFGLPTPATDNWYAKACAKITADTGLSLNTYNSGVDGQTVAQMNADAATEIDAKYSPCTPAAPVSMLFGGTNDLAIGGANAATVISRVTTWLANRRARGFAAGYQLPLRRTTGVTTFEADRQTIVAYFRGPGRGLIDVFVDFVDDARALDPTNLTWFQDGVHPTAALAQVIGEGYTAPALRTYWGI